MIVTWRVGGVKGYFDGCGNVVWVIGVDEDDYRVEKEYLPDRLLENIAGGRVGTPIHGWIEFREQAGGPKGEDVWYSAITISVLVGRNYDIFGCLFGVENNSAVP